MGIDKGHANTGRRLTPAAGVERLLRREPALRFGGKSASDWRTWRRQFRSALVRLMGPQPAAVPMRPRVLARERLDGYIREKIVFDADEFSAVVAWVLTPQGMRRGERRPGLLCAHGHGDGKDNLVGVKKYVDAGDGTDPYKQIAVELCRREGFVVIAPDWRSFGERRDRDDYIGRWVGEHGADGCDLSYMLYGTFGYQTLTLDVCDARRCLDYLQARREVDPARLGVIGCSFGGTMSMYTAALDRRIKASVICCYLSTLADALGERGRGNTCGSQFLMGLRTIGEIADVAGLIAPRACLVQIGRRDSVFAMDDAVGAYRHLERIYRGAGARGQLKLDLFEGGHEHHLAPALEFLQTRL